MKREQITAPQNSKSKTVFFSADFKNPQQRKKLFSLFSAVIMILLFLNMIRICTQKEGFMGDEQYTYHFISETEYPSINSDRDGVTYLNNWHSSSRFLEYFTITDEEKFDISGTYNSIKKQGDPHPPLYYILMEIICSMFSVNRFTKWTGLGFNLFFYLLTLFMLNRLTVRITGKASSGLAACVIYSLSAGAASTVVFIRMYMMLTFAAVCFFYVHVCMWDALSKSDHFSFRKNLPWLFLTALFGIMTQYYFLIYAFFVCACMAIYLMAKRKWSFFFEYAGTMAAVLLSFVAIWPTVFTAVFSGYRGTEAIENLKDSDLLSNLIAYIKIINAEIFGSLGVVLILILAAAGVVFVMNRRNSFKDHSCYPWLPVCIHLFLVLCAYTVMIAKIAPYQYGRYVFLIYPLFTVLCISLTYRLQTEMKYGIYLQIILLCVLTTGSVLSSGNISYLYPEVKNNIELIREYSNEPSIVLTNKNRRYMSAADSIYFTEASEVYVINEEGINSLESVLAEHSHNKENGIILYMDSYIENQEETLAHVLNTINMKNCELLFTNEVSSVYRIRYE